MLLSLSLEWNGTFRQSEFSLESDIFSKLNCFVNTGKVVTNFQKNSSGMPVKLSLKFSQITWHASWGIWDVWLPVTKLCLWVLEHPRSHPLKPSPLCSRRAGNCNWDEIFRTKYFDYVNSDHVWIFLSMENFQGDSISKLKWKGFSFFLESSTEYYFWLLTRPCKS